MKNGNLHWDMHWFTRAVWADSKYNCSFSVRLVKDGIDMNVNATHALNFVNIKINKKIV